MGKKLTSYIPSLTGFLIPLIIIGINGLWASSYDSFFWEGVLKQETDSLGYYQYLPGYFITHDLGHLPYSVHLPTGFRLNVFHIGVAILQLPGFLLALLHSNIAHHNVTGYEPIFAKWQYIFLTLYVSLAFYWVWQMVKKHVPAVIAVVVTLSIYLGTNLLFYSVKEFGMSHAYSFFLFTGIVYYTPKFYRSNHSFYSSILIVFTGIAFLIKPNNGIIAFYPLLYNVNSFRALKKNLMHIKGNLLNGLPGVIIVALLLGLQIKYWHYVSGEYLIFSYGKLGEGFNFFSPELFKVLFSPQNGWFIYSPIVLWGVISLMVMTFKKAKNAWPSLLILVLAWYIFSSWWAWWFGAAYGHRAFIEYLPLLIGPMVHSVNKLKTYRYISLPFLIFIGVSIYVNIGMTINYRAPWDGPNWGWNNYFHELTRLF